MTGLSVSRLVNVQINLSPTAAARRGFGVLCIAGPSDIIDTYQRLRSYTQLEDVATDFGLEAPEYLAAVLFFEQTPRPSTLMIGRWAKDATSGLLYGGAATQTIATWENITDGELKLSIDGTPRTGSGIDFSGVTTMTGVAALIDAEFSAWASVTWDGNNFVVTSDSTGATSTVGYSVTTAGGTDIGSLMKMKVGEGPAPVDGLDSETPAECALILAQKSALWFGLTFAQILDPEIPQEISVSDHLDVAALIEGLSIRRIYAVTTSDTQLPDPSYTADFAYQAKALAYKRTFTQYSTENINAAVSALARAFSVNFAANRSTITLMYKQEPGIVAEVITETEAQGISGKNCNVFVEYVNDTAILQYGVMASGNFFDEIHGLSWFEDAVQNSVYNLLYTSKTKIPQTDAGQNLIVSTIAGVCKEAVNNGLAAGGQWNADGFGQLSRGDYLPHGFYIYTPPMALQPQAERETRAAPPIQVALKLAGAIHTVDVIIDVNR
jgi:hypothetical protein